MVTPPPAEGPVAVLLNQLRIGVSDSPALRELLDRLEAKLEGLMREPAEEFAKALAVTIINVGAVPGPGMIRECVRLARDFYSELEMPTPREVPADGQEGEEDS